MQWGGILSARSIGVKDPMLLSMGLVSRLHRNSAYLERCAALASASDISGHSDKVPVLAQHAEPEALFDRERFLRTRHSCTEPDRSVGKEPVGELSLSGEPK